jgi:hypothetical protein
MTRPRVWVDFMKVDDSRRLILTALGTRADLNRYGIELQDGMPLAVFSDDLNAEGHPDDLVGEGTVRYDPERDRWVLELDWGAIRHASDGPLDEGD